MEMPETTVSRYYPDKAELKQTLKTMFHSYRKELFTHTRSPLRFVTELLTNMTRWTDMFKALLHETFKSIWRSYL